MRAIQELLPVEPDLARALRAITARAHRLRGRGLHERAEALLRRAAAHEALPRHVGEGLQALADLFRGYPTDPAGMAVRMGGGA